MPAMLKERGSCPMCGNDVVRIVATLRGRMHETYACPDHGAVSYGRGESSLAEWTRGMAAAGRPASAAAWDEALRAQGIEHLAAR